MASNDTNAHHRPNTTDYRCEVIKEGDKYRVVTPGERDTYVGVRKVWLRGTGQHEDLSQLRVQRIVGNTPETSIFEFRKNIENIVEDAQKELGDKTTPEQLQGRLTGLGYEVFLIRETVP